MLIFGCKGKVSETPRRRNKKQLRLWFSEVDQVASSQIIHHATAHSSLGTHNKEDLLPMAKQSSFLINNVCLNKDANTLKLCETTTQEKYKTINTTDEPHASLQHASRFYHMVIVIM